MKPDMLCTTPFCKAVSRTVFLGFFFWLGLSVGSPPARADSGIAQALLSIQDNPPLFQLHLNEIEREKLPEVLANLFANMTVWVWNESEKQPQRTESYLAALEQFNLLAQTAKNPVGFAEIFLTKLLEKNDPVIEHDVLIPLLLPTLPDVQAEAQNHLRIIFENTQETEEAEQIFSEMTQLIRKVSGNQAKTLEDLRKIVHLANELSDLAENALAQDTQHQPLPNNDGEDSPEHSKPQKKRKKKSTSSKKLGKFLNPNRALPKFKLKFRCQPQNYVEIGKCLEKPALPSQETPSPSPTNVRTEGGDHFDGIATHSLPTLLGEELSRDPKNEHRTWVVQAIRNTLLGFQVQEVGVSGAHALSAIQSTEKIDGFELLETLFELSGAWITPKRKSHYNEMNIAMVQATALQTYGKLSATLKDQEKRQQALDRVRFSSIGKRSRKHFDGQVNALSYFGADAIDPLLDEFLPLAKEQDIDSNERESASRHVLDALIRSAAQLSSKKERRELEAELTEKLKNGQIDLSPEEELYFVRKAYRLGSRGLDLLIEHLENPALDLHTRQTLSGEPLTKASRLVAPQLSPSQKLGYAKRLGELYRQYRNRVELSLGLVRSLKYLVPANHASATQFLESLFQLVASQLVKANLPANYATLYRVELLELLSALLKALPRSLPYSEWIFWRNNLLELKESWPQRPRGKQGSKKYSMETRLGEKVLDRLKESLLKQMIQHLRHLSEDDFPQDFLDQFQTEFHTDRPIDVLFFLEATTIAMLTDRTQTQAQILNLLEEVYIEDLRSLEGIPAEGIANFIGLALKVQETHQIQMKKIRDQKGNRNSFHPELLEKLKKHGLGAKKVNPTESSSRDTRIQAQSAQFDQICQTLNSIAEIICDKQEFIFSKGVELTVQKYPENSSQYTQIKAVFGDLIVLANQH